MLIIINVKLLEEIMNNEERGLLDVVKYEVVSFGSSEALVSRTRLFWIQRVSFGSSKAFLDRVRFFWVEQGSFELSEALLYQIKLKFSQTE